MAHFAITERCISHYHMNPFKLLTLPSQKGVFPTTMRTLSNCQVGRLMAFPTPKRSGYQIPPEDGFWGGKRGPSASSEGTWTLWVPSKCQDPPLFSVAKGSGMAFPTLKMSGYLLFSRCDGIPGPTGPFRSARGDFPVSRDSIRRPSPGRWWTVSFTWRGGGGVGWGGFDEAKFDKARYWTQVVGRV